MFKNSYCYRYQRFSLSSKYDIRKPISCLIKIIRYKTENLFGVFVTEREKCYGLAEITSREGLVQGIK